MTAGSRTVYFDVLNDIVDKYHTTYHHTIKMKPIDVELHTALTLIPKMLNLK